MYTMTDVDYQAYTVDQTPDPRDKQIEELQDLVYFYKQIIRKLTKDDK